jgi:hypothetical protein
MVGVCVSGSSLILSSFTTRNLGGLIFLQGIIFGLASGTLFMVDINEPSLFFFELGI